MSIDVLPKSGDPVARPGAAAALPSDREAHVPAGRWWKRGLILIGVLAIGGAVTAIVRGMTSNDEEGRRLTHTIARGNLVVSVTEQGALESSGNTEVKCQVRGRSTVIWVIESGAVVEEGDVLVRLDTKSIEDAVSLALTNLHESRATLEESRANVAAAEISISAYLDGNYRSQMTALQRQLVIAQSNLESARTMYENSERLFNRGYITELEIEGNAFTVTQAELELSVIETRIDVLERFTREMQLETLNGNLTAARSKLEADEAGLLTDEMRLARAEEELENCVITAPKSGLVIYPSAAAWKQTPDITEGASVRKDQVLLLMPELSEMQVKVGIHESIIDRVVPGLEARVTMPEMVLDAEVTSVASVTRPAGWWTGNVVKYDTIIELPSTEGLKPGMSAEVEVILARHENVLTIPVAAVVETVDGTFCWVETDDGPKRRPLQLGDSNDVFIVVEAGLAEGEQVVLNPLAYVDDAQGEVLKPQDRSRASREIEQSLDESSADAGENDDGN